MSEMPTQANQLLISGELNPQMPDTDFHFADGRVLRIPTALLQQTAAQKNSVQDMPADADQVLLPVVEEQLEIAKRVVETGRIRLQKSLETYDVQLDQPLAVEQWLIERVAKHEVIDEAPSTRQEGETTVYPVVEERLVLTKELVLVEEIRITRAVSERRDMQTVVLRREKMHVEREDLTNRLS